MHLIELNHHGDKQMTGEFARQSFEGLKKTSPSRSVASAGYKLARPQFARQYVQSSQMDRHEFNERENEPPTVG